MDVDRAGSTFVAISPNAGQKVLAREHFAAPLAEVRKQSKLLGRQLDLSAVDHHFVAHLVDDDSTDFMSFFGGELTASPFERTDPRIEFFGYVGRETEVIEATRGFDTCYLTHGHGHERADIVKVVLLAYGTQGSHGEVWAIERLEHESARTNIEFVVFVFDQIDWVIPEIERTNYGSELTKCRGRAFVTFE